MSQRYAPPRERSPNRYERRPSSTTHPLGGSANRAASDSQASNDRDPPRGPRADVFRGGYASYTPGGRGRGSSTFQPRPGDAYRDRDRDNRPQSYRGQEDERPEWARRDNRDLGPPDRPPLASRDSRNYPPHDRSASPPRGRRDSRESLPPLSSRQSDNVPPFRGGLGRSRGRGDWDRPRDRTSFVAERGRDRDRERDLFSNRSPSRDSWRDREFDRGRPSGPDTDRGDRYIGRDRSQDRRDHDIWRRDPSPSRMSGSAAARVPSPANSIGHHASLDRASKADYEATRRSSIVATPTSLIRDGRRDGEPADYFQRGERRESSFSALHQPAAPQPTATAGLDYGPPPSAPAANPSEKPPVPRTQQAKPISPAMAPMPFQPPLGPKADRSQPTSMPKPSAPYEAPKPDQYSSRAALAPIPPPPSKAVTELFPKKVEQKPESKPVSAADKIMPANVPSGPRSSSFGAGYRSRPPLSDVSPQSTQKALPSEHRPPPIPTGPRSDRDVRENRDGPWQAGPASTSSRLWVSPDYNRTKPSIMSPINRGPVYPPTGPRSQSILSPHGDKARPKPPSIMNSAQSGFMSAKQIMPGALRALDNVPSTTGSTTEDIDMSLPVSSDDEAEDDDFDEDEFAASEAKHQKNIRAKEAAKPPPFLHDPTIRSLLIRVQFLTMIANDVMPPVLQDDTGTIEPSSVPQTNIGLPSPEGPSEDEYRADIRQPLPRGRPLRESPINPIPTPPTDDLPYLRDRHVGIDVFEESDDEAESQAVWKLFRREAEQSASEKRRELVTKHDDFQSQYANWKSEVQMLDRATREIRLTPAPASPAPSAAPSVTTSVGHERTRGGRNTTEADLQAAIALSQQTMKEEEERREREALESSVPNYEHEAAVPSMLSEAEARLDEFDDTSGLVQPSLTLDMLRFLPPQDDFDAQEQLSFTQAFCQTPKKWGKIAEVLPGRDFKQCIAHYYLTKAEEKYKEIWRRSQPKKKRGRAAMKQPRSTALMSELTYRDGEEGAVAVTDTGRPRRAAAPTFGETGTETESTTPAPPAKRAAGSKDLPGEAPPPKTARSRKTPGVTTKVRRTKAQIAAEPAAARAAGATNSLTGQIMPGIPDPSPSKSIASRERARTLIRADDSLIAKADMPAILGLSKPIDPDQPQYDALDDKHAHILAAQALNQPTSYWSVPEQQKFPQLIAYYGRDFASIAEFMKTKTSTMIKNHYNRQLADGKTDLEEAAKQAEIKRASGQTLGPPPSPAVQTKRRYEATPSTASATQHGRPTAGDPHASEPEYMQLSSKQGYTEDFPSNVVQRNFTGDLVAKGRADPGSQVLQAKQEETHRPGLLAKPVAGPGPRMGYFREENGPFPGQRQNSSQDNSPHQHPLRPGEHRFGGLPAGSPAQLSLGPPRELVPMPGHNMQQGTMPGARFQNERFGYQHSHARNDSATRLASGSVLEQARELASLRQIDPMSRPYSMIPPASATPPPAANSMLHRLDQAQGQAAPEPPKAAPAKRSNIMSILNDDPPEPSTIKRPSSESQARSGILSPQTAPQPGTMFDPSRNALRLDGSPADIDRKRTPLGFNPHPLREQQSGYGPTHPSSQHETWLDKFDPRPQSGMGDHRSLHSSPRTAQYSVVPPGSSNLRMEPTRPSDHQATDHRRAFLGQLSHPGLNASPPPSQSQLFRSLSTSSQQHSRVNSSVYQSQPQSQSQSHQQGQPSGVPSTHPQSTNSTPVSSLHQGRSSIDFGQHHRQSIQQHMLLQRSDPPAHFRDQERERDQLQMKMEMEHQDALRARELDAMRAREHESMLARERHERENLRNAEREPLGYRRSLVGPYGPAPPRENDGPGGIHAHHHVGQHQSSHHGQPPLQQRPMGYPPESVQRSFTPQPSHQGQQQPGQYNPTHVTGPPPPRGSPYHHHHQIQNGPKPLQQGPPPPPTGAPNNHPAYLGHFRTMSQDERR